MKKIESFTPNDGKVQECRAGADNINAKATCHALIQEGGAEAFLTTLLTNGYGMIGHYEAKNAEAGKALLEHAAHFLRAEGAGKVIGPMNGSTWARYRLALPGEPGDGQYEPSTFFAEPTNPPEYPQHFADAGFSPIAHYESRVVLDLEKRYHKYDEISARLKKNGFALKHLSLAEFDSQLKDIYELSIKGFRRNAYYSAIEFSTFLGMYQKMGPLLDEELVILVYDKLSKLVAFCFSFPDPMAKGRLIIKTILVDESVRSFGLGIFMTDETHRRAKEKGYESIIHALIHSDNRSNNLSHAFDSQIFRRYVLFGKDFNDALSSVNVNPLPSL